MPLQRAAACLGCAVAAVAAFNTTCPPGEAVREEHIKYSVNNIYWATNTENISFSGMSAGVMTHLVLRQVEVQTINNYWYLSCAYCDAAVGGCIALDTNDDPAWKDCFVAGGTGRLCNSTGPSSCVVRCARRPPASKGARAHS
eukprot:TRINITY_DN71721_c0_g1_i1.p1 TRINITY_DN71721_c0_g1~~TRINITY_DN71721_c0_g1_i1.p1  ORF type:complete len:167 (+),score=66.54 TRINITY_DN71721_c0_g1_i1:74-502(+)